MGAIGISNKKNIHEWPILLEGPEECWRFSNPGFEVLYISIILGLVTTKIHLPNPSTFSWDPLLPDQRSCQAALSLHFTLCTFLPVFDHNIPNFGRSPFFKKNEEKLFLIGHLLSLLSWPFLDQIHQDSSFYFLNDLNTSLKNVYLLIISLLWLPLVSRSLHSSFWMGFVSHCMFQLQWTPLLFFPKEPHTFVFRPLHILIST